MDANRARNLPHPCQGFRVAYHTCVPGGGGVGADAESGGGSANGRCGGLGHQ